MRFTEETTLREACADTLEGAEGAPEKIRAAMTIAFHMGAAACLAITAEVPLKRHAETMARLMEEIDEAILSAMSAEEEI